MALPLSNLNYRCHLFTTVEFNVIIKPFLVGYQKYNAILSHTMPRLYYKSAQDNGSIINIIIKQTIKLTNENI